MNSRSGWWGRLGGAVCALSMSVAAAQDIDEVLVVTSRLREASVDTLPASVTVLPRETLASAGLQHFEDVMALVPNLNWSAGTARPRYFQLRGIGELDQYQGAPNPSVGFLIDDIDFSGVGVPATTFDVEQIEVLRGPQGSAYGANALAGLVSVRTRDAQPGFELRGEATAGDYGTYGAGAVIGGSPDRAGRLALRLVAQHYGSDGFRRNAFLGRDDTNGYDEDTLRARARWRPADTLDVGVTAMLVDIDDGYDAFSIDNSRVTQSDHPGVDRQRSVAGAVDVNWRRWAPFELRSVTTWADSKIDYGFDGDWGNDAGWGVYAPYDYTSDYARRRRTASQDLRLVSARTAQGPGRLGWIAGAYALDLREDNDQHDAASGADFRALTSRYRATNLALYGEVDWRAGARTVLSLGARAERRDSRYHDLEALSGEASSFAPTDTMWGGNLSVTFEQDAARTWYATLSRGYKAGGFNIGSAIPADRRQFDPESLWNLEAGLAWRAADGRWSSRTSLFYMRRESQQVSTSQQLVPGDPLSYVFFTDNAARGRNYGLEASAQWALAARFDLAATLGLLGSEYLGYRTGDPVRDAALDGRDQAHAPRYQYSLALQYRDPAGPFARADLQGVDDFYFDTSHDQRSNPHTVVNLRIGYAQGRWSVAAFARNVFDERYAMRGFYFGVEPPDFRDRRYVQLADGRLLGVTLDYRFR
ncbi:MAG: TonB-dependent receptor [Steroidobacteraceae bacterium]